MSDKAWEAVIRVDNYGGVSIDLTEPGIVSRQLGAGGLADQCYVVDMSDPSAGWVVVGPDGTIHEVNVIRADEVLEVTSGDRGYRFDPGRYVVARIDQ